MRLFNFRNGNWGLKFVAFVLAVVIYYAVKNGPTGVERMHERHFFRQP